MSADPKEPLRILAPNPSPLTGPGTNSFLIGRDHVAVIDPGPDDPGHLHAILDAAPGPITHILVTHAHRDHSAGALALSRRTQAPVLAFGAAESGRSAVMRRLAAAGMEGGGEGLDRHFAPDRVLRDGDLIESPDWRLQALHMPGHAASHLCFLWGDQIFCGDLVMGWASTIISPPDGDLIDYLRSLARLDALAPRRMLPAHGDAIENPAVRLAELVVHRRERSAQILAALCRRSDTADGLAQRLYQDIAPGLLPAAARNCLAHLIALAEIGAVATDTAIGPGSVFRIA
ncbi:MAG: MBL fold metallo-hydrolase [Paracoccus sp. (in: a-proteobacteria)]